MMGLGAFWRRLGFSGAATHLTFDDQTAVTLTQLIAEGGFSYVYKSKLISDPRKEFAVKKIIAQDLESEIAAKEEAKWLRTFSGQPGFLTCYGVLQKNVGNNVVEFYYLLELCPNGSLVDQLYTKVANNEFRPRHHLQQERILELFEQLVCAVTTMHKHRPPVAHRDLKLENVLGTADGRFVLCDFGSCTCDRLPAKRSRKQSAMEEDRISKHSTMMYRAPEMCDVYRNWAIDEKVDIWALGCILFSLCFRRHPFASDSTLAILNCKYELPSDSPYSETIHTLICAMLTADPCHRPTAEAVLGCVRTLILDPDLPDCAVRAVLDADTPGSAPTSKVEKTIADKSSPTSKSSPWDATFDKSEAQTFMSTASMGYFANDSKSQEQDETMMNTLEHNMIEQNQKTISLQLIATRAGSVRAQITKNVAEVPFVSRTSATWEASFGSIIDEGEPLPRFAEDESLVDDDPLDNLVD